MLSVFMGLTFSVRRVPVWIPFEEKVGRIELVLGKTKGPEEMPWFVPAHKTGLSALLTKLCCTARAGARGPAW